MSFELGIEQFFDLLNSLEMEFEIQGISNFVTADWSLVIPRKAHRKKPPDDGRKVV